MVTKRRESGSPRRSTGRAGDPWGYRFVKRLADIVVSLLVIVVLLAPCLVMAAIIALQSKGSPFYTQERVGLGGRHFNLLKFRSMAADADDVERYFTPSSWTSGRRSARSTTIRVSPPWGASCAARPSTSCRSS